MKRTFTLPIFSLLAIVSSLATIYQSQAAAVDPPNTQAVCPAIELGYSYSSAGGGCTQPTSINWTVTGGTIIGGIRNGETSTISSGINITVVWDSDNPLNRGTVALEAFNQSGYSCATASRTYSLRTLNGQLPGSLTGESVIQYGDQANRSFSVGSVKYPERGTSDPNPMYVSNTEGYVWEYPAGWTVVGSATSYSIVLKPNNCTGGAVKVRGKSNCGNYYSEYSNNFNVVRSVPTPGPISGFTDLECAATTPINYSISSVGAQFTYEWTKPTGWSGSSTGTSIQVTPNGANGGTISVKAKYSGCSATGSPRSLAIGLHLFNPESLPYVSGGDNVCTGGNTFTLTNLPSGANNFEHSVTNCSLYATGSCSSIGFSSRMLYANNPTSNGSSTISWKVGRSQCPSLGQQTFNKSVWVGKPATPGTLTGPTSPNIGYTERYRALSAAAGATSYNWTFPFGLYPYSWSIYSYNSPYDIWAIVGEASGYIQLTGQNICGVGTVSLLWVTPTGQPGCNPCQIANPINPAKGEVSIAYDLEKAEGTFEGSNFKMILPGENRFASLIDYYLHDQSGNLIFHKRSDEISPKFDVSSVPEGLYVLTIDYGNAGRDQSRILVVK